MDSGDPGGLRKRKVRKEDAVETPGTASDETRLPSKPTSVDSVTKVDKETYWLTRIVLLRYIGFIYCNLIFTVTVL